MRSRSVRWRHLRGAPTETFSNLSSQVFRGMCGPRRPVPVPQEQRSGSGWAPVETPLRDQLEHPRDRPGRQAEAPYLHPECKLRTADEHDTAPNADAGTRVPLNGV